MASSIDLLSPLTGLFGSNGRNDSVRNLPKRDESPSRLKLDYRNQRRQFLRTFARGALAGTTRVASLSSGPVSVISSYSTLLTNAINSLSRFLPETKSDEESGSSANSNSRKEEGYQEEEVEPVVTVSTAVRIGDEASIRGLHSCNSVSNMNSSLSHSVSSPLDISVSSSSSSSSASLSSSLSSAALVESISSHSSSSSLCEEDNMSYLPSNMSPSSSSSASSLNNNIIVLSNDNASSLFASSTPMDQYSASSTSQQFTKDYEPFSDRFFRMFESISDKVSLRVAPHHNPGPPMSSSSLSSGPYHRKPFFNCSFSPVFSTIAYTLLALFINVNTNAIANIRRPHIPALPDLGFELFPQIANTDIPDGFIATCGALYVIFVFFSQQRWIVLRRSLFCWATIFMMRALTVTATALPDPSPRCRAFDSGELPPTVGPITCGDMIFSGHSVFFLLTAFVYQSYCALVIAKVAVWALTFAGLFLIIATRLHYSVDVVLAIIITSLVWWILHLYALNHSLRSRSMFMRWFEQDYIAEWANIRGRKHSGARLPQQQYQQYQSKTYGSLPSSTQNSDPVFDEDDDEELGFSHPYAPSPHASLNADAQIVAINSINESLRLNGSSPLSPNQAGAQIEENASEDINSPLLPKV